MISKGLFWPVQFCYSEYQNGGRRLLSSWGFQRTGSNHSSSTVCRSVRTSGPSYTVSFTEEEWRIIKERYLGRTKSSIAKLVQAEKKRVLRVLLMFSMDSTSVGRESWRILGALETRYNRRCGQSSCLQEWRNGMWEFLPLSDSGGYQHR